MTSFKLRLSSVTSYARAHTHTHTHTHMAAGIFVYKLTLQPF